MSTAAICFAVALSSKILARVPQPVTLAWQHSVERTRLEEDYSVVDGKLLLTQVRTHGFGAGIDIPDNAKLIDGWWAHRPTLPPQTRVLLAGSPRTPRYQVCHAGKCTLLGELVGEAPRALAMLPCPS